jgi:tetratricopeptide (TPR) repeat protein
MKGFPLAAALCLSCLYAQRITNPTTTGTSTTNTTGGTTGTANLPTITPPVTTPTPTPNPVTTTPKSVFISGRVMTDDGSPLPGNIAVQSVCAAQQRTVAHTSSQGDFEFEWGARTANTFEDASDNGRFSGGISTAGTGTGSASALTGSGGARGLDPMANCDLRAVASGYTSSRIDLYSRDDLGIFDVGAIILHRISGDEGHTISMLALKAPKDAKKSFDKGTELARGNKPADAALSFQKAVASYPQYADAWLGLGMAESRMGSKDAARDHFLKATELDDKLTGPWQELGFMAFEQAKWEDAARYLAQAVRLDPIGSPKAWYINAVANYNLQRFDVAERSVRAELKLDSNPRSEYVLGLVLIARKDMKGAAAALRQYIGSSPGAPDVESAKKQLSRVESQLGQ